MQNQAIQLIVGLCNPGTEYQNTRHNAGADFVLKLAQREHCDFLPETKFKGLHAKLRHGADTCHLLMPTTYMNHSGQAIRAIAQFYKIPAEAILVAHDELDLPVGSVKLKKDGGHAGHNGLKDTIAHLGSKSFLRLRIGIGRPEHSGDVSNYVLKKPSKAEQPLLDEAIEDALTILPELLAGNIEKAMRDLHT